MSELTTIVMACPACAHEDELEVPSDDAVIPGGIYACGECSHRWKVGIVPHVVIVEPFVDEKARHWVRRRVQDALTREDLFTFDVDPQFAAIEAKDILTMVLP